MYQVIKYVNEHLGNQLSLVETADLFSYSKWHFCDLFRQYTGETFNRYVRRRRMEEASLDILKGRKIVDVALDYGYETQGGFNKAFLAEFGCIPSEFKQEDKYYRRLYEERKFRMYTLSDRISILRDNAVLTKPHDAIICGQREYYYTVGAADAAKAHKGENAYLIAAGTAAAIRGAYSLIEEGEVIVGHNFGSEEVFLMPEGKVRALLRGSLFTDDEIDGYFAAKGKLETAFSHMPIPDYCCQKKMQLEMEMAAMGSVMTGNHSVIGYEKVLAMGFEGLLRQVEQYEEKNGGNFYEPMKMICRAGCELGDRYAQRAGELLQCAENTPERQAELKQIVATCSQVPRRPARSFMEAVQSLWFAHMINTWEDTINANSLGRLDQILYPYYKADIDAKRITKQQAFDILCFLWIKLYRDYDVQQSCVGGCKPDGSSAVNDLSYLMLDVTEALDFVRCISVRYGENTEKPFVQRALEVVGHIQKGVPFFFNDDVMIPALVGCGIAVEDARDYTQIGCVETVIPGKSNPHAVTARANLLKAIEYTFGNGHSMLDETLCPGVETGGLDRFKTFDDLREAVYVQIRHMIDNACEMTVAKIPAAAVNAPLPYKSLLTDDCLTKARDFNDQGARYDYYQIMLLGLPNLADSLAAVKELVYKSGRYTLKEVHGFLKKDFPDEAVRLDFVNKAPKYGNDIEEVDSIAADVLDHACKCIRNASERLGYSFHAQPFTFLWMVDHGKLTAATPDGRRNREILAYSVSPMQGRDFNGFTALINSLARLPTDKTPGTTSAIVEVDPQLFTDKNISHFADIMLAAAGKGISNIQFNVVDADTLMDAQKHPDRYLNLAVRVSGFSQKFYLLDKGLQDHIIKRTKHKHI